VPSVRALPSQGLAVCTRGYPIPPKTIAPGRDGGQVPADVGSVSIVFTVFAVLPDFRAVCNHSATQMLGPRWASLGLLGKPAPGLRCKWPQFLGLPVTCWISLGLDGQAIHPA